MLSSMLLGIAYSFIMLCGLVFCVIAIYIAPFVFLNIVKMLFG